MGQQTPTVLSDLPSVTADTAGPACIEVAKAGEKESSPSQPIPWASVWAFVVGMSAVIATIGMFIGGGHGRGLFISLLCFSTLLLSAGFDSATGHIPNPITYTAILLGLSLNALSPLLSRAAPGLEAHWVGAVGPAQSLLGFLVFGLIGVFSRSVRGLGGGDMKLLAVVGALLGNRGATDALLAALTVAVVYSLANLVAGGRLNAMVRSFCRICLAALCPQTDLPEAAHRSRTVPLAIPMFLGLFLSMLPPVASAMAWFWGT
jgi:prepilin signal peptidase PulO-like enzyme (type II secretory pathway)